MEGGETREAAPEQPDRGGSSTTEDKDGSCKGNDEPGSYRSLLFMQPLSVPCTYYLIQTSENLNGVEEFHSALTIVTLAESPENLVLFLNPPHPY
jgi:hypothetical protein